MAYSSQRKLTSAYLSNSHPYKILDPCKYDYIHKEGSPVRIKWLAYFYEDDVIKVEMWGFRKKFYKSTRLYIKHNIDTTWRLIIGYVSGLCVIRKAIRLRKGNRYMVSETHYTKAMQSVVSYMKDKYKGAINYRNSFSIVEEYKYSPSQITTKMVKAMENIYFWERKKITDKELLRLDARASGW